MSEAARIGAVVVAHGDLAKELVEIAETIIGHPSPHVASVAIGWKVDLEDSRTAIREAVRSVDQGKGVIILTDMFGGTPSNLSFPFLEKDRVEIITGVNLPMVVKMASQEGGETWGGFVRAVKEQGKGHITIAGDLLEK